MLGQRRRWLREDGDGMAVNNGDGCQWWQLTTAIDGHQRPQLPTTLIYNGVMVMVTGQGWQLCEDVDRKSRLLIYSSICLLIPPLTLPRHCLLRMSWLSSPLIIQMELLTPPYQQKRRGHFMSVIHKLNVKYMDKYCDWKCAHHFSETFMLLVVVHTMRHPQDT